MRFRGTHTSTGIGWRLVPVIVTGVPIGPEDGEMLVMAGAGTTVKLRPPLLTPLTFTTTFPVVAPRGISAWMLLFDQKEITVTSVPLTVTVLLP